MGKIYYEQKWKEDSQKEIKHRRVMAHRDTLTHILLLLGHLSISTYPPTSQT